MATYITPPKHIAEVAANLEIDADQIPLHSENELHVLA